MVRGGSGRCTLTPSIATGAARLSRSVSNHAPSSHNLDGSSTPGRGARGGGGAGRGDGDCGDGNDEANERSGRRLRRSRPTTPTSTTTASPPLRIGDAVAIVVEEGRGIDDDAADEGGDDGDHDHETAGEGGGSYRDPRRAYLCRLSPRGFRPRSSPSSSMLLRYDDSSAFLSLARNGGVDDDDDRREKGKDGRCDCVERRLGRHLGEIELVLRTPPRGAMAAGAENDDNNGRFFSMSFFDPDPVDVDAEDRGGIVVVPHDDEADGGDDYGDDDDSLVFEVNRKGDSTFGSEETKVRVYRIAGRPRPLASVTLSRIRRPSAAPPSQRSEGRGRKAGKDRVSSALRGMASSCAKSCLTGRVVAMGATVRVDLPDGVDGDVDAPSSSPSPEGKDEGGGVAGYYEVTRLLPAAAAAQHSPKRCGGDEGVFLILPSTRITLLEDNFVPPTRTCNGLPMFMEDDDGEEDSATEARNRSSKHQLRGNPMETRTNVMGAAANVILDTLHAVGEASKLRRRRLRTPRCKGADDGGSIYVGPAYPSLDVPRALLLTGPPGVGKTHAVRTAMRIYQSGDAPGGGGGRIHFTSVRGSELLGSAGSGHPSDAMMELRRLFASAAAAASAASVSRLSFDDGDIGDVGIGVSLIFLDECDALFSSSPFVEAQLAILLDRVSSSTSFRSYGGDEAGGSITDEEDEGWRRVVVVAATNRVDAVPQWLRRPGRLDREVVVSPPNAEERLDILCSLISANPGDYIRGVWDEIEEGSRDPAAVALEEPESLADVAEACVGYVAADLSALVRRAAMIAAAATCHDQEPWIRSRAVNVKWLKRSMQEVGASALRDAALSAPPRTRWDDIAGKCGGAKMALRRAVEWPRTKKESFSRLGLTAPRGILLHGPPGCAKTTLAKAAAGASGVAFLSLAPADVYSSSYVGEAEAVVRRAFTLARSAAPCILFFDEIDAILGTELSGNSGSSSHGMNRSGRGSSAEARVLSTFLNEMDGVDSSSGDGVLVLGATNRPFVLDAALLRPGRFDKCIFVPPPDVHARRSILSQQIKRWEGISSSRHAPPQLFDVDALAQDNFTGSMTGAEIVGACREAAMLALREAMQKQAEDHQELRPYPQHCEGDLFPRVSQRHLEEALKGVAPLLRNSKILREYDAFEAKQGFH